MFSLSTLVFTGFFFLLSGAALGAFLLHVFRANVYSRELEQRLHDAESTLQTYQRDVAESFSQTANHVHELTQCYREMQEHLANSALRLATPEIGRKILESANSNLGDNKKSYITAQNIEPPRDWAPKEAGSKGTLSADYGLRDDGPEYPVRATETPDDYDFDGVTAKRY
ncbi:MAG TPA: DUF1043 family protein [Cellvibrio sp.]|nr:DUF1043 family protein [Cellvibrio sp.]